MRKKQGREEEKRGLNEKWKIKKGRRLKVEG